jgi:GNAT superfamily N-acetyltransferase
MDPWQDRWRMSDVSSRLVEPGDADALADLWMEFGRYYAELDSIQYREPEPDGLVDWFRDRLMQAWGDDYTWLAAVRADRVVGAIQARILRPSQDGRWQLVREVEHVVLKIDSLIVTGAERRAGVGRLLMKAVEVWGAARGASEAVVISAANSPTSVPFYEEGLGYQRKTIGFWKSLG